MFHTQMSESDAHRLEKATRDSPTEATPTSVPAIPNNTVQHLVDTHSVVDTLEEYTGTGLYHSEHFSGLVTMC